MPPLSCIFLIVPFTALTAPWRRVDDRRVRCEADVEFAGERLELGGDGSLVAAVGSGERGKALDVTARQKKDTPAVRDLDAGSLPYDDRLIEC